MKASNLENTLNCIVGRVTDTIGLENGECFVCVHRSSKSVSTLVHIMQSARTKPVFLRPPSRHLALSLNWRVTHALWRTIHRMLVQDMMGTGAYLLPAHSVAQTCVCTCRVNESWICWSQRPRSRLRWCIWETMRPATMYEVSYEFWISAPTRMWSKVQLVALRYEFP